MVPAAYSSSDAPKELHVYVSAASGAVIASRDRLRTYAAAAAAPPPSAAVEAPPLLPASAYVTPRSDSPTSRAAAERINKILASKYDGPSMVPSRGVGQTLYSGEVPLDTAQVTRVTRSGVRPGDVYVLTDLQRLGQRTYDLRGREDEGEKGSAGTGEVVAARRNTWGNGRATDRATAAADAHWGMGVVFDYYLERHNRLGIDGKGTPIYGRTHLGRRLNDAYWTGNYVTYGDGSRPAGQLASSCEGLPPLVTLDITGHEISHGVIESSSRLSYEYSFGGLNEATADILSVCIQDFAHEKGASPRPASFFPGSQMFAPTCPQPWIRSMVNPADDGKSWSCWHPSFDATWVPNPDSSSGAPAPNPAPAPPGRASARGRRAGRRGDAGGSGDAGAAQGGPQYCYVDVHWSSGPANRAFWLMSKGLGCQAGAQVGGRPAPAPLGIRKACDVWYRALTSYFTPVTDYYEARASTLAAAADLFPGGEAEVAAVSAAWDVVGAPDGPDGYGPRCDAGFAVDAAACAA
ncbi:MAG: hypothetical protein J3K34DRAFT_424794 [Monoraphidium minutum]|nr:MAG: hypothetical protein J3K34DRAFT_424794 [Monoraphidium minutum]